MLFIINYLEILKGLTRLIEILAFLVLFGVYTGQNIAEAQVTRYVSTTGINTDPASSTSWATSTTNLQGAINSLTATGGEVWVATGVYHPTGITNPPFSERDNSFSMKAGVAIYGSFRGHETALNQRPIVNPGAPGSTTLSGEIGDPNSMTDNSYHVIQNNQGLTNTAILDGFVVADGYASSMLNLQFDRNGAGMFNNGLAGVCSPLLRNCLFTNNIATVAGGALFNYALQGISSPTLTNCSFLSNSASAGGAVFNSGVGGNSSPTLTNCSFLGNRAITILYGAPLPGGAMQNNSSSGGTGGKANPVLTNCIVWDNGTDPIHNGSGPVIVATYCVFDVRVENYVSSPTNQTAINSPFAGVADLRLAACSPAINAGLNSATGLTGITTDGANNPRIVEGRVDIGAFEFQGPFLLSISQHTTNGSVVCEGSNVTAFVSVSGIALSYQWYKQIGSGPALDLGAAQSTSVLSLTNVQIADNGSYFVIVIGNCNSLTSNTFGLSVNQVIGITRPPAAQSMVCVGSDVTAGASFSGTGNITFSWYRDGTLLLDQTAEMLSLTNVQTFDTGSYSVVITGTCNSVTSTAFSLTVDAPVGKARLITNGTLTCNTLSVTLTTSGDNANSFTLLNTAQTSTNGNFVVNAPDSYTVRVGSMNSCTATTTLTTTVDSDTEAVGAILQASSLTFCAGNSVTLTAVTKHSGGLVNYTFSGPGLSLSSTSPTAVATQAGIYSVVVSGANGCTSSVGITLSVVSGGVGLGTIASGGDFCVGSVVRVAVPVTGSPSGFQWYQNGVPVSGQTSATLTVANVQSAQTGSYVLLVTASCASVTSTAYNLTVSTVTPNVVITLPNGSSVTVSGNSPRISLPTGGNIPLLATGGVFYEWLLVIDRVNGYEIRQVDSNAMGLFTINRAGPYRLTVRGSNGCQRTVEGVIVSQ